MTKAIDFFKRNAWPLAAAGMLLFALGASKGGLAALAPLGRFLIPAVVIYLIYRAVKKKVAASIGANLKAKLEQQFAAMNQQQGAGPGQAAGRGGQRVIDLCPKCGGYQQPGHRCANR
jgi:hypothetical protein